MRFKFTPSSVKKFLIPLIFFPVHLIAQQESALRKEVSQYGITWTFEKSVRTGKYITGDWWVIGPVKIIKVTPSPGPVSGDSMDIKKNRWNDTSLKNDTTMRNGSMVVTKTSHKQSYDSRAAGFSKEDVIHFPL